MQVPPRPRIYCGLKPDLPEGYHRFGLLFECLKKGYGACLYHGRLGQGLNRPRFRFFRLGWWIPILLLLVMSGIFFWISFREQQHQTTPKPTDKKKTDTR